MSSPRHSAVNNLFLMDLLVKRKHFSNLKVSLFVHGVNLIWLSHNDVVIMIENNTILQYVCPVLEWLLK